MIRLHHRRRRAYALMMALVAIAIVTSLGISIVQILSQQRRQIDVREAQVQCEWIATSEWDRLSSQGNLTLNDSIPDRRIELSTTPPRHAIASYRQAVDKRGVPRVTLTVAIWHGEKTIVREEYLPPDWLEPVSERPIVSGSVSEGM